jgi:opacity protein-like surface antigen
MGQHPSVTVTIRLCRWLRAAIRYQDPNSDTGHVEFSRILHCMRYSLRVRCLGGGWRWRKQVRKTGRINIRGFSKEDIMRVLGAAGMIILLWAVSAAAVTGDIGIGLGAAFPRGQFNRYADNSFTIGGYGGIDMPGIAFLGLRVGVQGFFLENHEHDVNLGGWLFTEEYSTNLWKFTIGAEIAPEWYPLVPYATGGIGIYYFSKTVNLNDPDGEQIDSKRLSSETDVGWNGRGGIRVYFTPEVALDLSMQYDKITNMKSLKARGAYDDPEIGSESVDTELITLLVGVNIRIP